MDMTSQTELRSALGSLADLIMPHLAGKAVTAIKGLTALSRAIDGDVTVPGLALPLKGYQKAGVLYASQAKRCLIGDEMGLGKTPQAIATLLLTNQFPALIVVPPSLTINWVREFAKFAPGLVVERISGKTNYALGQADAYVIGDAVLADWADSLILMGFKGLVIDESHRCFPAGSQVLTSEGYEAIETIAPGRLVASVQDTQVLWQRVINTYATPNSRSIVKVIHAGGSLLATDNHPIHTSKGIVNAGALVGGDQVRVVRSAVVEGEPRRQVLQSELLGEVANELITVRSGHQGEARIGSENRGQFAHAGDDCCFAAADADAQSDAVSSNSVEGVSNATGYGPRTVCADGQWARAYAGRGLTAGEVGRAMEVESCNLVGSSAARLSNQLQGGSGLGFVEAGSGSGRVLSPLSSSTGSQEGHDVVLSRVDRVEVLESGHLDFDSFGCSVDTVYNLEVEGTHNYVVNGVVVDNCKTYDAKRTKAATAIARKVDRDGVVLLLSGTAVKNRSLELLAQIQILGLVDSIGGFQYFLDHFAPKVDRYSRGSANMLELHDIMRDSFYVRRLQDEVPEIDLPGKGRISVAVEMSGKAAADYKAAEKDLRSFLRSFKTAKAVDKSMQAEKLVKLGVLRHLIGLAKIDNTVAYVNNILDENDDNKVLVFANHRDVVKGLQAAFECNVIMGGMKVDQVEAVKEAFQTGSQRVLVLNLEAGGVGHNLTAANHVVFAEYGWTYADQAQAEKRADRIGQTRRVLSHWLIGANGVSTVDEKFLAIINSKAQIGGAILDGKLDESALDEGSVAAALLEMYEED